MQHIICSRIDDIAVYVVSRESLILQCQERTVRVLLEHLEIRGVVSVNLVPFILGGLEEGVCWLFIVQARDESTEGQHDG